jgi:uncharacterized membrane protein YqiK
MGQPAKRTELKFLPPDDGGDANKQTQEPVLTPEQRIEDVLRQVNAEVSKPVPAGAKPIKQSGEVTEIGAIVSEAMIRQCEQAAADVEASGAAARELGTAIEEMARATAASFRARGREIEQAITAYSAMAGRLAVEFRDWSTRIDGFDPTAAPATTNAGAAADKAAGA